MIAAHIPKPCHKAWEQMTPNEKGRFCSACNKTVIDFTKPEHFSEIENFENVCGRFKRFEPQRITYKKKWYHRLPKLYRKTVVALLTFISFHLLSAFQAKAQEKTPYWLDISDRRGTIKVKKVNDTIRDLYISGRVTDQTANEPVPFAKVVIMQNDTGIAYTVTDLDGYYKLTIKRDSSFNETIDLIVSFVGFSVLTIRDIQLSQDASFLDLSIIQMETQMVGLIKMCNYWPIIVPSEDHSVIKIGGDDLRYSPYRH